MRCCSGPPGRRRGYWRRTPCPQVIHASGGWHVIGMFSTRRSVRSLGELKPLALMLTSFFSTSFHLEGEGERRKLVRGRKFKDKRNKKYALGRAGEDAAELSRLTLE